MIYLPYQRKISLNPLLGDPKVAIPIWLRECIQVTDQDQGPERDENVMEFPRRPLEPVRNDGQSAINLVCQAAEVEKLSFAERRTEAAEKALNICESRIASAEARLSEAESRAKKAETLARELGQALASIEDAIRSKLLGESPRAYVSRRGAAA
jgi:hypothetical protein